MDLVAVVHESLEYLLGTQVLEALVDVREWPAWEHPLGVPSYRARVKLGPALRCHWSRGSATQARANGAACSRLHLLHDLGALGPAHSPRLSVDLIFSLSRIIVDFLDLLILLLGCDDLDALVLP